MVSFLECSKANGRIYGGDPTHVTTTFFGHPIGEVMELLRSGAVDVYYNFELDGLMPVHWGKTSIPTCGRITWKSK